MRQLKEENAKFRREQEEHTNENIRFQEQFQKQQEQIQKLTKERDDNNTQLNKLHNALGFAQISSPKEKRKVGRPRIAHVSKLLNFDTDVYGMMETLCFLVHEKFTRCTNNALREYFHQNYTDIYNKFTGNVEALPFED